MSEYKFSIVCPHYDGVISDDVFLEGMQSIDNSTYKNFEVLVYHDGPTSRPLPDLSQFSFTHRYKATKKRYNDWGHSLRDLGIREAKGEYIVHFNPDNILYPKALEALSNCERDILISPVVLEGTLRIGPYIQRTGEDKHRCFLDGYPPIFHNIDCMQLVMKRSLWLSKGGWYNKEEQSDGKMYEEFCKEYHPEYCSEVIGVNR